MLTSDAKVQLLNRDGKWTKIDLIPQVKRSLSERGIEWNEAFVWNSQAQNKIIFDAQGDAYILLNCSPPGTLFQDGRDISSGLLLHSRDGGMNWVAYPLRSDLPHPASFTRGKGARMEFQDAHNRLIGPPPIKIYGKGSYLINPRTNRGRNDELVDRAHTTAFLLLPNKRPDGSLDVDVTKAVKLADDGLFADLHSGAGNTILSVGDQIHIVYAALNRRTAVRNGKRINVSPCKIGTPNYLVTYNRTSGLLSDRRLLGCAGKFDAVIDPAPNVHNQPAITVDSRGFLHVVLGAHHDHFLYMRSLGPNDPSEWSPAYVVGESKRAGAPTYARLSRDARVGSYTYVGLICDQSDRIHIVARWAGIGYRFRLVHMSRPAGGSVMQEWDRYSDSYARTHYPSLNPDQFRWQDTYQHQTLLVPFTAGYVVYHHKLTIDRRGNLFVSYRTLEQQFDGDAAAAYCRIWPESCGENRRLLPDPGQSNCSDSDKVCRYHRSTTPRSPALLMSTDGGKNWRLGETNDLVDGVGPSH